MRGVGREPLKSGEGGEMKKILTVTEEVLKRSLSWRGDAGGFGIIYMAGVIIFDRRDDSLLLSLGD